MSGIYIPNKQIPESCGACPLASGYDIPLSCSIAPSVGKLVSDFQDAVKNGVRTEWCPLIPVPDHGRLGDLDALADKCDDPYWCVWLSDIEDAPTVIPADKEAHS